MSGAVGACAVVLEVGVAYGQGHHKLESGAALVQISSMMVITLLALCGAVIPWRQMRTYCLTVACAGFFIDGVLNMALSPVLLIAAALVGRHKGFARAG